MLALLASVVLAGCATVSEQMSDEISKGDYADAVVRGEAWIAERDAAQAAGRQASAEDVAERVRVQRMLAKARLGLARAARGVAALRAFGDRYGGVDGGDGLVREAWVEEARRVYRERVVPAEDVEAHRRFRDDYPGAPDEADSWARELALAWDRARGRDVVEGYLEFRETYDDAPGIARLRAALDAREASAWYRQRATRAGSESVASHEEFQRRYPRAADVAASRRRLVALAFADAGSVDTEAAWLAFRAKTTGWPEADALQPQAYRRAAEAALREIEDDADLERLGAFRRGYPEEEWQARASTAEVRLAARPLQRRLADGAGIDDDDVQAFLRGFRHHPRLLDARPLLGGELVRRLRSGELSLWESRLLRIIDPAREAAVLPREAEAAWRSATTPEALRAFALWYPDDPRAVTADAAAELARERADAGRRWPRAEIQRTFARDGRLDLVVNVRDCGPAGPRWVSGVPREMFTLLVDDERLTPVRFRGLEEDRPLDVVFNVDLSGSMAVERQAVADAVLHFSETFSFRHREARVGLVAFADNIHSKAAPTASARTFQGWMAKLPGNYGGQGEDATQALLQSARIARPGADVERVSITITDEPLQLNREGLASLGLPIPRECQAVAALQKCMLACQARPDAERCLPGCVGRLPFAEQRAHQRCLYEVGRANPRESSSDVLRFCAARIPWDSLVARMGTCTRGVEPGSREVATLAALLQRLDARPFFLIPDAPEMVGFLDLSQRVQGTVRAVPDDARDPQPYVEALDEIAEQLSTQVEVGYPWAATRSASEVSTTQLIVHRNTVWRGIGPLPVDVADPTAGLVADGDEACPSLVAVSRGGAVRASDGCGAGMTWRATGALPGATRQVVTVGGRAWVLDDAGGVHAVDAATGAVAPAGAPAGARQLLGVDGRAWLLASAAGGAPTVASLVDDGAGGDRWEPAPALPGGLSAGDTMLFSAADGFGAYVCVQAAPDQAWCLDRPDGWRARASTGLPAAALGGRVRVVHPLGRPEVALLVGADGLLRRSADGGRTWRAVALDGPTSPAPAAAVATKPASPTKRPAPQRPKAPDPTEATAVLELVTVPGERPLVCAATATQVACSEDSGLHWEPYGRPGGAGELGLATVGRQLFLARDGEVQQLSRIVNRDIPSSAVYFATDDDRPLPNLHPFLFALAEQLAADANLSLLVQGHADLRGTLEYNRDLARRRAAHVAEVVASRGVDPARIEVRSYGEERPLRAGLTPEALARNRRVELIVTAPMNSAEDRRAFAVCDGALATP